MLKLLKQWGIIIAISYLSGYLVKLLHFPLPGNVTGMLILFILLCTKVIKLEMIEDACNFMIKNLAFFFIPAGVGLISCMDLLSKNWVSFLLICLITTIIVQFVTGKVVQDTIKLKENKGCE